MQKFSTKLIKLIITSILIVFGILFGWKTNYSYHCLALVFPLILLAVIAWSLVEVKVHQRLCFKNCYLKDNSLLAKFLTGKFITIVFYLSVSIAMTLSIMHSIIDYPKELWGYIALHIIIVIIVFKFLNNKLINTISTKYVSLFSREITINILMIFLFIVYSYIIFNTYEPEYLRETLPETIKTATNSIRSECYIVDYILRLKTELDAWFWWSVIYASDNTDSDILSSFMWAGFITFNGLAILGINRFIAQVVYGLNIMFEGETNEEKLDA